ncbi:MAG: AraC family transcriptional regulator, partial [Clostridia bacterium]|nr:AraC family transcriptional regulator [Clostridia bacterium]
YYRVFDYETTLEIDRLFQKIHNAETHPDFYTDALLTAHVTELLVLLYTREFQSSYNYPRHISDIMKYINEHLKEDVTIDSLCHGVHLSKSYACSSFKSYTNMTITQYLIQCRLTQAKKQLLETETSISDIAMQTGFSSFSFFCQTFRKYESCTPLQFRKKYQISP